MIAIRIGNGSFLQGPAREDRGWGHNPWTSTADRTQTTITAVPGHPGFRSRPDLARRISQVDVSDPRNAVVIVDQDTARIRLGDERFVERLQSYVDLASTLHEQVPAIEYVDLRFGERVYVGSQAGVVPARAAGPPRRPATAQ